MDNYDFGGWATRNDLVCNDGRVIRKNAFQNNDGCEVPLIWNHDHTSPDSVLGHALLENREDGVYAWCKLNDTPMGKKARTLVENGDVRSLSIWANKLQHVGSDVVHGVIRELSLVLAGANPGAYIDTVMAHGDDEEDSLIINYDENAITLCHSAETKTESEGGKKVNNEPETKKEETQDDKTVQDVIDSMTEEQRTVMYAVVAAAIEDSDEEENENEEEVEEEEDTMKHNVFDQETANSATVLSHADEEAIVAMAKATNVGSLQAAISMFEAERGDTLAHGIDEIDTLFPEHQLITPGAPEIIRQDQSWVMKVINKIHKSPYSRIRTRQADARIAELKAKGYNNREEQKKLTENIKLLGRKTEPQTIYKKDELHRDDITDITDFDVVAYVWNLMKDNFYETLALAALVGDGREDTDPDKIHQENVRSILNDEELYVIHKDVDVEAARAELQGTNTSANFGENYIYAEAMITAALYAREQYKGTGTPDYYCAPHSVNIMLLARDLNGRRIYDSKADLAKALNVNEIIEIEQFEGVTRTTEEGDVKNLHGIFVNLADYQFGSTKGGELTKFDDFDIDFNKYKYLMEARLSGALTKPFAAIVLEEPAASGAQG